MSDKNEQTISIRENALYNYDNVVQKIISGKITKLVRRKAFNLGTYRLKKIFSEKHTKLLDEHINILSVREILWIQLSNEESKEILGTDNQPIHGSYLRDLHAYWSKHELAMMNIPFLYLHDIQYVKKPIQKVLEI